MNQQIIDQRPQGPKQFLHDSSFQSESSFFMTGSQQSVAQSSLSGDRLEGLEGITVLIVFLLVVIVAIYLICLLVVVIRKAKQVLKCNAKFYFAVVAFYIVSKMILCSVLIIEIISEIPNNWNQLSGEDIEIILKNSIQLADLSTIELFLVSLYFYLKVCFVAIARRQNSKVKRFFLVGVRVAVFLCGLAFLIPLVIFDSKEINYAALNLISAVFNGIVIVAFLTSFFYLNFTMTGIMVEKKLNSCIKTLYKMLCIILLSRLLMLGIEIAIIVKINDGTFESFVEIFENIQGEIVTFGLCFIAAVLCILLTEALPFMYCLRNSIVESFIVSSSINLEAVGISAGGTDTYREILKQELLKDDLFEYDEPDQTQEPQSISMGNFRNVVDLNQEKSSIWSVKKGVASNEQFVIKMAKHQISSYILEDIETEIKKWSQIKLKHLVPVSFFLHNEVICIVEKYMPFSLDEIIDKLDTQRALLKIALKVAEAIQELHQNQLPHGSLKPSYILFSEDQKRVFLTGLGLQSLKKYLSLITGYCNKNLYTSVELLSDRNNVIIKPKKPNDVYSFGVILYEIITKNRLYREQTVKEIQNKFCEENFRPKIPEELNPRVKSLIRKCWQQDSAKRPTISDVVNALQAIIQE